MTTITARRSMVIFVATAIGFAGCVSDDPDPNFAALSPKDSVTVVLSEFAFLPSTLSVVAGSTVTLIIVNDGFVDHEFMVGQRPAEGGGFEHDLLVDIVAHAAGNKYTTAGLPTDEEAADPDASMAMTDEEMEAMEPADEHDEPTESADEHDEPMGDADASMVMTDEEMEAMEPADEHDEPMGDADASMVMTDEEMEAMEPGGGHAGHSGSAITVKPGGRVELELQIPLDAAGDWEFGCFIEGHFEAGMHGTLSVVAAVT